MTLLANSVYYHIRSTLAGIKMLNKFMREYFVLTITAAIFKFLQLFLKLLWSQFVHRIINGQKISEPKIISQL